MKMFFVKNIHFSMGNDNLERNSKSEPKKFPRLCTFKKVKMLEMTDERNEEGEGQSCWLLSVPHI